MPGFNSSFDPFNSFDQEDESGSSYTNLILLTGLAVAMYAGIRFAESHNRLNYDNRLARIVAGFLIFITKTFHAKKGDLAIEGERSLIAAGPHRTGWESLVIAAQIKGAPPQFWATEDYNAIPGVSSLMRMFKAIPIKSAPKGDKGHTSNNGVIELTSKVLNEKGCVALFPQGNFARIGQEPPRIYAGAAKVALMEQVPIRVIRLDGFWSLENPLIPLFIRNNSFYRAFFSMLHLNNVRTTSCCEINFHLLPENKDLSDEVKITEICAQLYAYFRSTQELTDKQIDFIKTEISSKAHLLIWKNKVEQDDLRKKLTVLKDEESQWTIPKL
jgi:1-acyl-sn-glycerol-3-phosphate acyltransferase